MLAVSGIQKMFLFIIIYFRMAKDLQYNFGPMEVIVLMAILLSKTMFFIEPMLLMTQLAVIVLVMGLKILDTKEVPMANSM